MGKGGRETDVQEKHRLVASPTAPARDLCPAWELNRQTFSPQAGAQSITETSCLETYLNVRSL